MSGKTPYSAELRERARKLYEERKNQYEVAGELGVSQSTVNNWLKQTTGKKISRTVHCPDCDGRLPEIKNMMFCLFCGGDIASPAKKAVRDLDKVLDDITKFYPVDHRDFAVQTINKAIEILKEVG